MIQATTPTIILTLPDTVDLSTAREVYVTFRQKDKTLTKTMGDNVWLSEDYIVNVFLTQAETLEFAPNRTNEVQVNWINADGTREATLIATFRFLDNLIPEVIGL